MENNEKVFAGFLMLMAVWSPLAAFAALVSVIVLRLIFCFSGAEEHHQRYFCIFILINSICALFALSNEFLHREVVSVGRLERAGLSSRRKKRATACFDYRCDRIYLYAAALCSRFLHEVSFDTEAGTSGYAEKSGAFTT